MKHAVLILLLPFTAAAVADTIYKYERADGRIVYSSRAVPGARLLESFEYTPPPARAVETQPSQEELERERRVRTRLQALETAWREVQEAQAALEQAEERLRTGIEPLEAEPQQLEGLTPPLGKEPTLVPPAVGGPLPPPPPAVGGPQPSAAAAVGGPVGKRHGGGGRSPEHAERQAQLHADVRVAEERLDEALRRYNLLR